MPAAIIAGVEAQAYLSATFLTAIEAEGRHVVNNEQEAQSIQLNLGETQRNAGRDYHEILALQSVEVFLAITPQAEIDRHTLDNANFFRHRFGFEAPRRRVREQVLAIQQANEYSDREIRWLRWSGQLRVNRDRAYLAPSRSMAVAGWIQVGVLGLMCAAVVFSIADSAAPPWKQMLGQSMAAAVSLAGAWVLSKLYIEPWRLVRTASKP